jgi:hypothetical protein
MKTITLVVIVLVVVAIWCIYRKKFEKFINDAVNINVTWDPSNIPGATYKFDTCIGDATTCGTDPTDPKWVSVGKGTTNTPSRILNQGTCTGCDFGQTLTFAVSTVVNGVSSSYSTSTINLIPTETPGPGYNVNIMLLDGSGNNVGLGATWVSILITVPNPSQTFGLSYVKLTRASTGTVYTAYSPISLLDGINAGAYGQAMSINLSTSDWAFIEKPVQGVIDPVSIPSTISNSWLVGFEGAEKVTNPGTTMPGDVIEVYVLDYQADLTKTPPGVMQEPEIFLAAKTAPLTVQGPAAPSSISWTVQQGGF